ncbi:hypothetical protein PFISCL1PPCAC_11010 [Pristionchus fissidentatus]|uniref:F-box domain-containing protein n=1 Tax=Pristionchus fissidentatus TaxID=1538716 RepID=A0AAV5VK29_9BILA|nr:hypothetical protein PFISCL1PPCAC_11010 [Pristionchus fissidentatus]
MSDTDELSVLEHLPEELVWAIFDHVSESVRSLSQTSRTLRSHVQSYISMPARIQIINQLMVSAEADEDEIQILMYTSHDKKDLFDMRLEANLYTNGFSPQRLQHNHYPRFEVYEFVCTPEDLDSNLRNLSVCIGAHPQTSLSRGRVGMVELYHMHEDHRREYYNTLLQGINFSSLELSLAELKDDDVEFTRKLIVEHKVEHLVIFFIQSACDHKSFLLELSSLVRSMEIALPKITNDWDDDTSVYRNKIVSYRMQAFEWVPLVVEMFGEGKKLDKLCIDNHDQPGYFTSDCIKQFKEKLPFLGKRICFKFACKASEAENSPTFINEHIVEGSRDQHSHLLTIKHSTRQHEGFRF